MNKKKQPEGFCLPRPSNNLRDKDGVYKVRFIPIFGTALGKYVGPVTHMDKAIPMAETGCRIVAEMFNEYQNKLCKKGLYADPTVIQNWPLFDFSHYRGQDLFTKAKQKTPVFGANLTQELFEIITPPVAKGHIWCGDATHICFELTDIKPKEHSFTIALYCYNLFPIITIEQDGTLSQSFDTEFTHLPMTHIGLYEVRTKPNYKFISTDAYDITTLMQYGPTELYTLISPEHLHWSEKNIELYQNTILQAYVDFNEVFRRSNHNPKKMFQNYMFNAFMLMNLADELEPDEPNTIKLTHPLTRGRKDSYIVVRNLNECDIGETAEDLTPSGQPLYQNTKAVATLVYPNDETPEPQTNSETLTDILDRSLAFLNQVPVKFHRETFPGGDPADGQ